MLNLLDVVLEELISLFGNLGISVESTSPLGKFVIGVGVVGGVRRSFTSDPVDVLRETSE